MPICLFSLPKEVRESVRLYHFEPCVKKAGKDECWEWIGSKKTNGYGQVIRYIDKKQHNYVAHRLAWMFRYNCPVPPELNCCHTCDNPGCVNAEHIFLGTQKMNIHDAQRKGRMGRRKEKKPIQ